MRLFFKIIILIGLFACPVFVQAQGELSLEQLERIVTARELGAKQERIVDMIIEDNPAALEQELKNGFSANSYIWGNSLLGFAIDFHRWEIILLLLKYGADLRAPLEKGESGFSNLSFLRLTLEASKGNPWKNYHFYQCLTVVAYYGRQVEISPVRGSGFFNSSSKILSARYTWELVSQKNVPVVWAAAFTNNIDLLLALNLKGTDVPYAPSEELFCLLKEKHQDVFPSLPAQQATRPSYWIKKWAANAECNSYQSADYEKILQSF